LFNSLSPRSTEIHLVNRLKSLSLAVLTFGVTANFALGQASFDFSNISGQLVNINGTTDKISFGANSDNRGLKITAASPFSGLVNYLGSITGSFTIGAVTVAGPSQTAAVSGTGSFKIFETLPSLVALTADLSLVKISSLFGGVSINNSSVVNLSNFQYSGSDPNLLALKNASLIGVVTTSFQFSPNRTLLQLTANGASNSSSYSGTVLTQIPEPSTYAALLAGLTLVVVAVRRRR